MKKIHRALALIMAIAVICCLPIQASAANEAAAVIDYSKTASLSLYKYDLTGAEADGAWDTDAYVSTGIYDQSVNDAMGSYAVQGVEFMSLRVADSHIVFNSVSCTDGRMFRSDFKAYYGDIRGVSNAVSRENGLSVIEPKGRGKQYAQWTAEKQGKPTIRGLIRQDMDAALSAAISMQTLFAALEKQGYTVKRGAYVKHTAVRPPGSERFIRLDSLGEGYTEADLKAWLRGKTAKTLPFQVYIPQQKRYSVKRYGCNSRKAKPKGLRRLYLHYLYLLAPPRPYQRRPVPFNVRSEERKLSQYKRQFALLQKYRIENESQLSMLADALQTEIDSLVFSRQDLYRRKRRGKDVVAEISEINLALRPLRRELRCCQSISASVPQIHEHIRLSGQAEEQGKNKFKEKEVKQHGSER